MPYSRVVLVQYSYPGPGPGYLILENDGGRTTGCIRIQLYVYHTHRIQYTDSMAPSFVKFCQVYHAFARAHTTVYLGPILLLHEYTLHSYTTKYTLHYVYSNPVLSTVFCISSIRMGEATQPFDPAINSA